MHGAFLCLCSLSLTAQVTPVPGLKSPALLQNFVARKTPRMSQELQALSAQAALRQMPSGTTPDVQPVLPSSKYMVIDQNKVLVNITMKKEQKTNLAQLRNAGVDVTASYGRAVSGFVSFDQLAALQTLAPVQFVRPVYKLKSQLQPELVRTATLQQKQAAGFGPVISQGDQAQASGLARDKFKITGKGVKIGILSDSYNSAGITNIGVAEGELPGTIGPYGSKDAVEVLQDYYENGTDEGRALAEILHDVAPGAELAFHTASYGQANFAKGITDLADIGCKIIVEDALYPDEPFFQNGIIAQAINAAQKKGVTCFSAAGNKSTTSYESEYRGSDYSPFINNYINGTAHSFSAPGQAPNYFQPINIPLNGFFMASFQWNQPFYSAGGLGAQTDMDILLLDANGTIVSASLDDNILSGDPLEMLSYTNNTGSTVFYITILKFKGPDPSRLKYVSFGDDFDFYSPAPGIPGIYSPALVGHPNAEGTITVGAANYINTPAFGRNPPQAEYFSSQGGVALYYNDQGYPITPVVRKKPEITAPDGGNTSFFWVDSRQDTDDFPNFFGTSASAAHAAGVAALMIEAQKINTITPAQIKGVLTSKAIDMDDVTTIGFDVGFDYKTGAGLIQAEASVEAVRFPKLYVKNLQVKAVCSGNPSATRNWKITNPNPFEVEVSWLLIGFPQYGRVKIQPGETLLATTTGYLANREVPNIVLMDWEDNFGFPHLDVAVSNKSDCNNLSVARNGAGVQELSIPTRPDVAEAFPNPFSRSFKVYISCPAQQQMQLELFGVDGRQLTRRTVASEGVVTMDASGYRPGMYYLKITGKNFSKTIQLVKL